MSQFDWRTEDDASWQESVQPPVRPSPEPHKRPWPVLFFILAALLLAGWVVYRQVRQQIESATTAVQADILSTHNLVQTAVARNDLELFRSQLSGRDPVWTEAEETILVNGLMAGRDFWGWRRPLPLAPAPLNLADLTTQTGVALELAPDLNAAVLQFPQEYDVTTASGTTETVTLAQTAVYRRGSQRWLLSPPDDAFWGSWSTSEGDFLRVIYPSRDEIVVQRLATDLETMLHELCRTFASLDCPDDLQVSLRLDTNPDSLLTATNQTVFLDAGLRLQLPAPTLFGLPQDTAGYRALYRAYGAQVATAVVADLVGWECCRHAPFFQVLTDYLLDQIDLRPWPVTSADHTRALRESASMTDLNLQWDRRDWVTWQDEAGWELYTAVDFLLQTYPFIDPVDWLRGLGTNRSLLTWVNQPFIAQENRLGPDPAVLEALDEEWWQFAYAETLLAQENEPLPTPFPDQDLQVVCIADGSYEYEADNTMTLHQYDLQQEVWTAVLTRTGYLIATPMLDDSGWVLQNFPFSDDEAWRTEIWRDGQSNVLFADDYLSLTLGQFDPTGRYLISYVGNSEAEMPQQVLLDLADCTTESCESLPLPGQLFWSPDGRYTLIADANLFEGSSFVIDGRMILFDPNQNTIHMPLQLGDQRGQPLAGSETFAEGYSPFWLDNQRFGYIQLGADEAGDRVVIASIDNLEPQVVLTLADVAAMGPSGISAPASLHYVLANPAQPSLLFVVALDALGREAYLFSYDLTTETVELRLRSLVQSFHALGFSPDGRWLTFTGSDGTSQDGNSVTSTLFVHEIATHETQTYVSQLANFILSPLFDWSADGRWLLFVIDDRIISLVAPDYGYQWVFAHNQGSCTAMNWINE